MNLNETIAQNTRRIREELNLSLVALAREAHLSRQSLAQVEAGSGNPTVSTIENIAAALGVSPSQLLRTQGSTSRVLRGVNASWRETATGEAWYLEDTYGQQFFRTQIISVQYEQLRNVSPHAPGTDHQMFVISGRIEAGIAGESAVLGPGDYMKFPGDIDHFYRSIGGRAVAHLITASPILPTRSADQTLEALWSEGPQSP
jgi:transcriptional regulator with XRE-family HTH domain